MFSSCSSSSSALQLWPQSYAVSQRHLCLIFWRPAICFSEPSWKGWPLCMAPWRYTLVSCCQQKADSSLVTIPKTTISLFQACHSVQKMSFNSKINLTWKCQKLIIFCTIIVSIAFKIFNKNWPFYSVFYRFLIASVDAVVGCAFLSMRGAVPIAVKYPQRPRQERRRSVRAVSFDWSKPSIGSFFSKKKV